MHALAAVHSMGYAVVVVRAECSPSPTCAAQLQVRGRDKIFGVFNFWANLNRSVEVKVVRVGEADQDM